MDIDERILLTPGPVHIDSERWSRIVPLHHRTDIFRRLVLEIETMLQELAGTGSPAYLLTASGTGAMESAIANLTSPGSSILVISGGKFGDRWKEIADGHGCKTDMIRFAPGESIDISKVEDRILAVKPEFIAVTHVESSTGLLLDIERLVSIFPEQKPFLIVDAIASLGSDRVDFDGWGVDLLAGAGQKALRAPPGISFVLVSERARDLVRKNTKRGFYLDYAKYDEGRKRGDLPFTPAIQSFQLLHDSLGRIFKAGKSKWIERQKLCSGIFTEAASSIGLDLIAETPSVSVQAFRLPPLVDAERLISDLARKERLVIAGGQGELEGKIIRTGFPGLYSREVILRLIRGMGRQFAGYGHEVDIEKAARVLDSF
ncbi:MAG: alanine--glyoxylate aminotransferase family protein [Candidatus Krumholzibacteriota bacterium]|nr:alanine--glyoxylate aminotransferase family protein [Candidatus Krumholzibacteriota bacterium]